MLPHFPFHFRVAAAAAGLCLAGGVARAALQWAEEVVVINARANEQIVRGRLRFTNASERQVTVTRITTSCDCTSGELQQKSYAPGESGELLVTFTVGNRKGVQEKTVTLTTDEPGAKPQSATVIVNIEEPFVMTPSLVSWARGSERTARTIRVQISDVIAATVRKVQGPDEWLAAELVETGPKTYEVRVTPRETGRLRTGKVTVLTDYPAATPTTLTIYAAVR